MIKAGRWTRATWVAAALSLAAAGVGNGAAALADAGNDVIVTTMPAQDQPQGLIPKRLVWPGVVVIVVIAIFVTAALAGSVIRANLSDDDADDGSGTSGERVK